MNKKNNHYIPQCLLRRWVTNNGKYDGINVLDIKSKTINFSYSKGKKAFSFAIYDNLYILTQNDNRQINLENWFDGLENSISLFIDKISLSESNLFKNLGHLNKLIMGLISFEYRSRYFIEKGVQYLDENPEVKKGFNGKSSIQIILENIVNATTDYSNQLFPIKLIVWESISPILLCDKPILLDIVEGVSFCPLTPNLFLSFQKTTGKSTIEYLETNEKFVKGFNQLIINNARDWIVSIDREVLEQIKLDNQFDDFDDHVIYNKVNSLLTSYEY